jgi:PAS domain S-box-containing protein
MVGATSHRLPAAAARRVAWASGVLVASIGAIVLWLGWAEGVTRLTTLAPGFASMKANSALAFILEGVGLVCINSMRLGWQRTGQALGIAGALIGALTAFEYLAGIDLGIDQLLVADHSPGRFPGRMTPIGAVSLVAIGFALQSIRGHDAWPSQLAAISVGVTSFVALIGYGYGTATLYSFGQYGAIAVHAAFSFVILCVGIVAARQHDGITAILTSPGPGGQLARRFLPVAIFLPTLIGWLRLLGQRAGWYDTALGVALFAVTLTGILLVMTLRIAAWIDRADVRQRRTERELELAQREVLERDINLTTVTDASDDAIIGSSVTGIIRTWNGGAERLFGYSSTQAIGQSMRLIVPPELNAEHDGILAACAAGERLEHVQTVRLTKTGTLLDVSLSVAPIRSVAGDVIGLSEIIRNITDRLQIEAERQAVLQQLEAKTAELQRSNDELQQFAYVASHDLQEPLRMVSSYTELLASRYEGQLDERADKYIRYISEGASRMQRLIRELLNYARVGTRSKDRAPVDLNEVAAHVLLDLKTLITNASAEISIAPLPIVVGDDVQLGQVLQNLISNAIKFRAPDRTTRVSVTAQREAAMWRVAVEDNGIGMDMKFHDRVFEIFQRLHERNAYEGTGVGLAIVKRIVERHGGRVWFESAPGQGTRFFFTVPTAPER